MPAATSLEDIYYNSTDFMESARGQEEPAFVLAGGACCAGLNQLSSSYSPTTSLSSRFAKLGQQQQQQQFCQRQQLDEDEVFQKLLEFATTRTKNSNTINCDVLNYNNYQRSESRNSSANCERQANKLRPQQANCKQTSAPLKLASSASYHNHKRLASRRNELQPLSDQFAGSRMVCGKLKLREKIREPLQPIFFYHDDDLSTSSAPDSFPEQSAPQANNQQQQQQQQQHYLTIEELKLALNSCWLCGCNWSENHLSLDCQECGGYSMSRPCLKCEGKCAQTWRRNVNATHDRHRAAWLGECAFERQQQASSLCSSEPTSSSNSSDTEEETSRRSVGPSAE